MEGSFLLVTCILSSIECSPHSVCLMYTVAGTSDVYCLAAHDGTLSKDLFLEVEQNLDSSAYLYNYTSIVSTIFVFA